MAQTAPIVQPGAPGQAARTLSADEAIRIADNRFSTDDVRFMQDMIVHHHQAVQMAALVKGRTNRQSLIDIAGRIDASQADEINFMRAWLTERGQTAPNPADPHAAHGAGQHQGHGAAHTMAGMATPEQMAALTAASGPAFDQQFLTLMIAHHEGAVEMVRKLLAQPGSGYDPVLYKFANDVTNEQQAEIRRLATQLRELSADPRSTLKAGFRDAGEAISNLNLVASLPKPTGFYDPENPAGLPPPVPTAAQSAAAQANGGRSEEIDGQFGTRSPFLSFANTDMAFAGDMLAVGNYHGFNLYRLGGDAPQLISSVVCPGGQGDVSIIGDLLIMSVEQTSARVDCGRQGVSADASPERFRGVRIFNISNPAQPVQVGQVQTCRGSHTHSIVSGDGRNGSVIVYNSGTASIRDEKELAGCIGEVPGDDRTALFRIDVIEIPVADPSRARIIDSPTVFADDETGQIAGLWRGGDHGDNTQDTSRTDHCHDITVFPSGNLAAGACSGNGVIFDITDPRKPKRIDAVTDTGFAYWHSATFNNDGTKVLFTDEWGGGARPRCRAQDPQNWGANAFYDIVNGKLEFRSHYKLPAAQNDQENCVAHNGSIIPVPGRDIFVQSWYQGGISVIDFTDSAKPVEIAYFDRGALDPKHLVLGGYWSSYWYNGRIYATEIARGLDILSLQPSDYLTQNEIAAAGLADQGARFNPQQQVPVTWPAHPLVARAYVDQLQRGQALPASAVTDLTGALDQAAARIESGAKDPQLATSLDGMARGLAATGDDAATARRKTALRETLTGIAAKLR
ncbi:DUF305 domain-containing protein [Brevundimonas sp.]|uniref:DUF305 domain-containing protein n=1 Tax=Brevundimonas sp. TaxID=1871086 RepID=UPI0025BAC888|nr:DUF305 domain-containing protein [Brevundimonas sp.]